MGAHRQTAFGFFKNFRGHEHMHEHRRPHFSINQHIAEKMDRKWPCPAGTQCRNKRVCCWSHEEHTRWCPDDGGRERCPDFRCGYKHTCFRKRCSQNKCLDAHTEDCRDVPCPYEGGTRACRRLKCQFRHYIKKQCWFHRGGTCDYHVRTGRACRFSHPNKGKPCLWWDNGNGHCKFGLTCWYFHEYVE